MRFTVATRSLHALSRPIPTAGMSRDQLSAAARRALDMLGRNHEDLVMTSYGQTTLAGGAEIVDLAKELADLRSQVAQLTSVVEGHTRRLEDLSVHAMLSAPLVQGLTVRYVAIAAFGTKGAPNLKISIDKLLAVLDDPDSTFCATRDPEHLERIRCAVGSMSREERNLVAHQEQDGVLLLSTLLALERDVRYANGGEPIGVVADLIRIVLTEMGPKGARTAMDQLAAKKNRLYRPPSEEQLRDYQELCEA